MPPRAAWLWRVQDAAVLPKTVTSIQQKCLSCQLSSLFQVHACTIVGIILCPMRSLVQPTVVLVLLEDGLACS